MPCEGLISHTKSVVPSESTEMEHRLISMERVPWKSSQQSAKAFRNYFEADHIWCMTTSVTLPGLDVFLPFFLACFL